MINKFRKIHPDQQMWILTALVALLTAAALLTITGHGDPVTAAVGVARWYGHAVEWVVGTVSFGHVTVYAEPFHSGQLAGFVAWQGFGHCAGVSWYGHPYAFHGCG